MVTNKTENAAKMRYLLVYGSETGQAKAIAGDIADKSAAHGLSADLHCADAVDKGFRLVDEPLLVLVCSTTGEGEPPDNAAKMLRRLKNKSLKSDHLAHLRYTILGLGDTNYTNFCQCPKDFHQRLQALGAQTFYAPGWADDGTGLDVVCDPWIEGLWSVLKKEAAVAAAGADIGKEGSGVDGVTKDSSAPLNGTISTATSTATVNGVSASSCSLPSVSAASSASCTTSAVADRPSTASLTRSIAPLCDAALSVPTESPAFLDLQWQPEVKMTLEIDAMTSTSLIHNGVPFPSATSDIFRVPVQKCWRLTSDDAVKTALDVCIGTSGTPLEHFRPGDAFAVIVRNPAREVDALLERLFPGENSVKSAHSGSEQPIKTAADDSPSAVGGADLSFSLSLLKNTTKVKAEVPPFIPNQITPRRLFEEVLDIRSLPKKGFLRLLAEYCSDEREKRRLLELSSKQGSKDYDLFVRQPGLSIVDILLAFPSAAPPLQRLIENMPRLQARSYSISSSPLRCPGRAHFVFNIVEFETSHESPLGKVRRGICTGMLDDLTKQRQSREQPDFDDAVFPLDSLSLSDAAPSSASDPAPSSASDPAPSSASDPATSFASDPAPLFLTVFTRPNPWFLHPDEELSRPLMMIGPGTGVAPFLGFLQHREKLMERQKLSPSDVGETWLYFGCRHQKRDFLYQAELERLHACGVLTHLETSFSRDVSAEDAEASSEDARPKYVQHRISQKADQVRQHLLLPNSMLYICGDAKNMARNVSDVLVDVLVGGGDLTKMAAMKHLADMREHKRYLQDVWA